MYCKSKRKINPLEFLQLIDNQIFTRASKILTSLGTMSDGLICNYLIINTLYY